MLIGGSLLKWNNVYNADCLEGLRSLPSDSVDLIVTSPPYNIGNFNYAGKDIGTYFGNNMSEEAYQAWQLDVLAECFRVLKPSGSLFYNHKVRIKDGKATHPLEWLLRSEFGLKQVITWDQAKGANSQKVRYFPFSERIYWMTKDAKVKALNDACLTDVWRVVPTHRRSQTSHLAVMPEKIVENILDTMPADNVLDPFAGSGTTLAVAKRYGKDFLGFEIDERYYEAIIQRLDDVVQAI